MNSDNGVLTISEIILEFASSRACNASLGSNLIVGHLWKVLTRGFDGYSESPFGFKGLYMPHCRHTAFPKPSIAHLEHLELSRTVSRTVVEERLFETLDFE
jgi:hypothetical protein